MLEARRKAAREISWRRHGKSITFYLPGMFHLDGMTGKYPAASITGSDCAFSCDHCKGVILCSMHPALTPDALIRRCRDFERKGCHGVLVSGGCNENGFLPWERFADAMRCIKAETGLYVSVHAGFPNEAQAMLLRESGADQALIDVVGDDETLRRVYHAPFGVERVQGALAALKQAGLPMVPHVVCGLDYGRIRGEYRALEMIAPFAPAQLAIVSLMPLPRTPMHKVKTPPAEAVADIIAEARFLMPDVPVSLGCARQRGNHQLELLALEAGINRLALPSTEAVEKAVSMGLAIRYQKTCCSVTRDLSAASWNSPVDGNMAASG